MPKNTGLFSTLRAAARGKKVRSEEEPQDDELDNMEEEDDDTSTDSEGEDNSPEDDDDDETVAEKDDGEDDVDAEEDEEDTGPAAAATRRERARCIAIFTHANADSHPRLAAKLLNDGTSKAEAVSLLNSVGCGRSTTGSLASRVAASQGNKRPGQDGAKSKSGAKPGSFSERMAAANDQHAQKQNRG